MSGTKNLERGVATVEYGITIGAVALVAAVMFAQTSAGVSGIWKQAAAAAGKSPAAASVTMAGSVGCNSSAHGDSKICSTGF
jgi:Flp pilus assembly pilin Flp